MVAYNDKYKLVLQLQTRQKLSWMCCENKLPNVYKYAFAIVNRRSGLC